jgi:hypothetical protein
LTRNTPDAEPNPELWTRIKHASGGIDEAVTAALDASGALASIKAAAEHQTIIEYAKPSRTLRRPEMQWRKATASTAGGNCVELAPVESDVVLGDSKDPDGPVLRLNAAELRTLFEAAENGELDDLD